MNKQLTSVILTICLSSNLFACSTNQTSTNINNSHTKTEQNTKQPVQQAKRVVALTSLAADLVYNLDKTKLVGIPNGRYTDIIAKSKFTDFPRVGTGTGINLETIIALKPDLVIGAEGFHDKILGRLKELGIPIISGNISSWQDLENSTKQLAQGIGVDPKPILDKYQSYLSNIPENGKTVLVLLRSQPTSSPNKESWAGNLIEKFKYKNMAADLQANGRLKGYLTLSQEKILEANPDKLFIIESANLNPDDFKQLSFWNKLKAVQNNQVYIFHHDGLITPTSVDNIGEVTQRLKKVATQ
jgi:iron complex transport system substrate-binding protein